MTKTHVDPAAALADIAASIKQTITQLESIESEGKHLTAAEIETIARKLQSHVDGLLVASDALRDAKSGG